MATTNFRFMRLLLPPAMIVVSQMNLQNKNHITCSIHRIVHFQLTRSNWLSYSRSLRYSLNAKCVYVGGYAWTLYTNFSDSRSSSSLWASWSGSSSKSRSKNLTTSELPITAADLARADSCSPLLLLISDCAYAACSG